jgi:hypothetical protein
MAEPCIHDLDPATCGVCNGAEKRVKAERPPRGPWFVAQFPGTCGTCSERIKPGEMIRADGDGAYLCEDCGDGA